MLAVCVCVPVCVHVLHCLPFWQAAASGDEAEKEFLMIHCFFFLRASSRVRLSVFVFPLSPRSSSGSRTATSAKLISFVPSFDSIAQIYYLPCNEGPSLWLVPTAERWNHMEAGGRNQRKVGITLETSQEADSQRRKVWEQVKEFCYVGLEKIIIINYCLEKSKKPWFRPKIIQRGQM